MIRFVNIGGAMYLSTRSGVLQRLKEAALPVPQLCRRVSSDGCIFPAASVQSVITLHGRKPTVQ